MENHLFFSTESQDLCSSTGRPGKSYHDGNRQQLRPSGKVDVVALVRSLQRTAGLDDCFKKGNLNCTIHDCVWRTYCLETPDLWKK